MQTAVLATHVQLEAKGFRQKDVRFMLELLSTWRWAADERRQHPPLHNTQIMRSLHELSRLGWIKSVGKKQMKYRLTRAGLVGILDTLRTTALNSEFATFWFLSHILQSYRSKLFQLIEKEGSNLPLPQKMDVEKILDGKKMMLERKAIIQERLKYWRRRIDESRAVVQLVKERMNEKHSIEKIVNEIERRYPYELNITKPITTFIAEIPDDLKVWELTEGYNRRAHFMWEAFARNLELELTVLDQKFS